MIGQIQYWRDLERWVPGGGATPALAYPAVPLGELLRPRLEPVPLKAFDEYVPITIHFDGTVERRKRLRPFKGRMYAAHPGDVVFSKIDVRNGALTIIADDFPRVVVTSEYPVHVPDWKQVDARYLALILRSPQFKQLLKTAATGTSGRKRVDAERFREIEIPLPDSQEQATLLDTYEAALRAADQMGQRVTRTENSAVLGFQAALGLEPPQDLPRKPLQVAWFRQLDKWSHQGILQTILRGDAQPAARFDMVPLEEVARVTYGLQKCPSNRPGKFARPYLRVANVQRGFLDLEEIKYINVPDSELPKFKLQSGDVLLCEGNSADLVGRGAIWRDEIGDCVHQNHVLRIRVRDHSRLLPEFVLEYINSPAGQAYFREKAKRTTNLASNNSTEVKEMPLPLPSTIAEQDQILGALRTAREAAAKLRSQAAAARQDAATDFLNAVFT